MKKRRWLIAAAIVVALTYGTPISAEVPPELAPLLQALRAQGQGDAAAMIEKMLSQGGGGDIPAMIDAMMKNAMQGMPPSMPTSPSFTAPAAIATPAAAPAATQPSSLRTGDNLTGCIVPFNEVRGDKCGAADSVSVSYRNTCKVPVDLHNCLEMTPGKWTCAEHVNMAPNEVAYNNTCHGTGQISYSARHAGDKSVTFPSASNVSARTAPAQPTTPPSTRTAAGAAAPSPRVVEGMAHCVTAFNATRGKSCGSPDGVAVEFRNTCTTPIDLRNCLETTTPGKWVCGIHVDMKPNETTSNNTCHGTGQHRIWARPAGQEALKFPSGNNVD